MLAECKMLLNVERGGI